MSDGFPDPSPERGVRAGIEPARPSHAIILSPKASGVKGIKKSFFKISENTCPCEPHEQFYLWGFDMRGRQPIIQDKK
jgi:hypothetical protein